MSFHIENAELDIDGQSYFSNSEGLVFIDSIETGNHHLSVTHIYYKPLDSTYFFNDSTTNIDLELTPLYNDFLPLDSIKVFTYSFLSEFYHASIPRELFVDSADGTAKINVNNAQIINNLTTYYCSAFYDVQVHEIDKRYGSNIDTIYQASWTQDFNFYQDENNIISVDSDIPYYWTELFWYYEFIRFRPISRGDEVISYGNNQWITKIDSGFTYINTYTSSGHHFADFKLRLLNVEK